MRDLRKESGRKADMMERKALLDRITRYADAYQAACPKTAESDLKLVIAYCSGNSAAHVALDHNCVESTVHRALNRVRGFLRMQDYDDRWKPLIEHIMEHSPNWGECEPEGILDILNSPRRMASSPPNAGCRSVVGNSMMAFLMMNWISSANYWNAMMT